MVKILRDTKNIIIISLLGLIVFSYLFIYRPLNQSLNIKTLENYVLLSESKEATLEQFYLRCQEGVLSISSRSMIRNQIVEYLADQSSWEELVAYTEPLYFEGLMRALDNLVGALRVVSHQELVRYGKGIVFEKHHLTNEIITIYDEKERLLYVISPVKSADLTIGHDILAFQMIDFAEDNETLNITQKMVAPKDLMMIQKMGSSVYDFRLLELDGVYTYYSDTTYGGYYFAVSVEKEILFNGAMKIPLYYWWVFVMIAMMLILVNNGMIISKLANIIMTKDQLKNHYKEAATKDTLTKTYSRYYFDDWVKRQTKANKKSNFWEPKVIVLVDVNQMKRINDQYGHSVGDQALILVTKTLKESVRSHDMVIRYGGDEFLLILEECQTDNACSIMQRVDSQLMESKHLDFNVQIAYGIEILKCIADLEVAIIRADQKMYRHKNKLRYKEEE